MPLLPVWLAVCAAAGAGLAIALPIPRDAGALLVAVFTAWAIQAFVAGRRTMLLTTALAAVAVDTWAIGAADERYARNPPASHLADVGGGAVRLEGRLTSDAVADPGSVRLRLSLDSANGVPADGDVALTVAGQLAQREWPAWRGERRIAVPATVRKPPHYLDEGVADDRLALARHGLVLVGSVKSGSLVELLSGGSWLDERRADVRAFIRREVSRYVGRHDPQAAGITTAILIGDRTGLSPELVDRLQASGTYHVIAISGGNIAIFASTLLALTWLVRLPPGVARLVVVAALWQYAALVGGGASVMRATVMASAYLALRIVDLRARPINVLATTAGAMLVAVPLLAADAGFLLTVGATAAIVTVASHLAAARAWPSALRAIVALVAASIATELALLPVSAALFGRVTVAGPVLNLVAVPAMAIVEQAGLCVVVASRVAPRLADLAGWVAAVGARAMVDSSALLEWLPVLATRVPPPRWWAIGAYFAAAALAAAAYRLARLPGRWRPRLRTAGVVGVAAASLWIVFHPWTWRGPWRGDGRLRVTSIDVGQGDATLIELPDQTTILVDVGGLGVDARFDIGARVVAPAMWAQSVGALDALLLTHGDPDHIGGAATVIETFRPRTIWEGIPVAGHAPMAALREIARRDGLRWNALRAGAAWQRAGVTLRIWHPDSPDWERRKVRNDDSVVLELRYGDVSVVLPGDISRDVESTLAPRLEPARLRVLKAAHHGSATSTSDAWLDALHPALVLVSCGRDNRFGHPAPPVLARLAARHITAFRTDVDGEVFLETDGQTLQVRSWTGRTWPR